MTLKDLMTADVENVLLDEDHFAEVATYIPVAGPSRSATVIVEEDTRLADATGVMVEVEAVLVLAGRDKDNTTIGGIDKPSIGDGLRLADGRMFSWTGEKTDVSPSHWWLGFERDTIQRTGTDHKRDR